jgi:hypothetical protein
MSNSKKFSPPISYFLIWFQMSLPRLIVSRIGPDPYTGGDIIIQRNIAAFALYNIAGVTLMQPDNHSRSYLKPI